MIIVVIVLRIVWQILPNLFTCGAFWFFSLFGIFILAALTPDTKPDTDPWRGRIDQRILLCGFSTYWVGMMLNAAVTLRNWGFMPVTGDSTGPFLSVWVRSTSAHHWLWLADHAEWWGSSIGDLFIASGILVIVLARILRKRFRMPMHVRAVR